MCSEGRISHCKVTALLLRITNAIYFSKSSCLMHCCLVFRKKTALQKKCVLCNCVVVSVAYEFMVFRGGSGRPLGRHTFACKLCTCRCARTDPASACRLECCATDQHLTLLLKNGDELDQQERLQALTERQLLFCIAQLYEAYTTSGARYMLICHAKLALFVLK